MDELELIENFEIDVIDTNQSQKENPLEEETLILSGFLVLKQNSHCVIKLFTVILRIN